jgi:serine phosphatase RsbU (regulator of sigma subunit)/PAS domain-containing protein
VSTNDHGAIPSLADEEAVWRLATALASSVTPFDVAEALALEGGPAAGGSFANMAVLEDDSERVRVVRHFDRTTEWSTYELSADVPACDAIRGGIPVLLASAQEIRRRYPDLLAEIQAAGLAARASVPLRSASGTILGAVGFGWPEPQTFAATQLRRVDLIAQLTGLALERAIAQWSEPWPNERLGQALETMPNGFCSVDVAFRIVTLNAEGEKLLRSARADLVGRDLFEVFADAAGSRFERQCRHAMQDGSPVGFEEYCAPLQGWFEIRAWPDRNGLNVYFSNIDDRHNHELERMVALDEAQQANTRLSLLANLSANLTGVGTQSEVFQRLSHTVAGTALADWCTIVVPSGEALIRIAAAHADPVLDGLAKRLIGSYPHPFDGPSPGVVVYRNGRPLRLERLAQQIIADLDDSVASAGYGRTLQLLGDGPGLIMPITGDGHVVAVLTMVRSAGEPFTDADVAAASEVMTRVSAFLDDARHVEAQREIAGALQDAALPRVLPGFERVVLAAGYRAASEGIQVGGDWYDAFELQTGRIALVVGDVAGHGVQAAAVMAQMRNALRANLFSSVGLADSLSGLSGLLTVQEPDAFATIICAELDPRTGELDWASAGHPAPILVSADGTSAHLHGRPAPPVGWMHTTSPRPQPVHRIVLEPGDRLLLFTDGLIERRGIDLAIGVTHLMLHAEQTRRLAAADACETILQDIVAGSHEDDVCLLVADFMA